MIKHLLTNYPNYNLKSFKEYNNDILVVEENYDIDGNLHGESIKWYDDGKLKEYTVYDHFKKNGAYKKWYPNGQLHTEQYYIDNIQYQTAFEWYESGELYQTIDMVNGKYHGKYKQWYDNGILALEVDYINGKKNGVYKYCLPNGKLETWRTYKADTLINTKIYPIGLDNNQNS